MFRKQVPIAVLLLLSASGLFAQNTPQPNDNPPAQRPRPTRRGNGQPCWQQAGIEKSVMEQRWNMERETREQVSAACSNSSLTPQQKNQQAREIHRTSREKIEGLVTPSQEKALTACQAERGMHHPGNEGGGGGCGEWSHPGGHPGGPANSAPGGNSGSNSPPSGNSSPQN
jgi:Spy/CpxP family protein refolding chaperone